MSRMLDIIAELEDSFNAELDESFDTLSILCQHEGCIHSECDCWTEFEKAVEVQLEKQEAARIAEVRSMSTLYRGEVRAGIHTPSTAEERNEN